MSSRLFFGGVPTRMDVDNLMKLDVSPGTIISYIDVEKIIGAKRNSNRFHSVATAWRKRLFRERLLQTAAYDGAFHILTADEAHDLGRRNISRIGRFTGRARGYAESIPPAELTGERRDKHNLLRREFQAIHEAVQKSAKEIAAPRPSTGATLRIAK